MAGGAALGYNLAQMLCQTNRRGEKGGNNRYNCHNQSHQGNTNCSVLLFGGKILGSADRLKTVLNLITILTHSGQECYALVETSVFCYQQVRKTQNVN